MTTEEAIQAFGLVEHVESIVATYEPGERRNDTTVRELKEACRLAITALRAQPVKLDRSRWEGCKCASCRWQGTDSCTDENGFDPKRVEITGNIHEAETRSC